MQRQRVGSSNLAEVGYNATSQTLEVMFQDGSIYQYYNVPQPIYDALMAAPSKGKFLYSQIKDRFPYARV